MERPTDGCVNENFTPTLQISRTVDGASADMIEWAQTHLSGHWGLKGVGQPLHRLINANNRRVICNASFRPDNAITVALAPYGAPILDGDSCDEFPFNATYESGAQKVGANGQPKPFVTTGAACAQVTAEQTDHIGMPGFEGVDWSSVIVNSDIPSAPCVRGHIPRRLNNHVGSLYNGLIRRDRLINKDPFWLAVTP
jgi:hypothetical protein